MSNTTQRIISAIVLVLILLAFASFGEVGMLLFLLITGLLFVDEFLKNFLNVSRSHFSYIISILTFGCGFLYFNFWNYSKISLYQINQISLIFIAIALIYLFFEKMDKKIVLSLLRKNSYLTGLLLLCPVISLSSILHLNDWKILIGLLLSFNFSVDTGAWFFGKLFGRKKIWPEISPKKTINGSIGGSVFSVIIASLISILVFDKISVQIILAFLVMSVLAQLGDFVESKLKRQAQIKDSSNIIPGHGGIYDRIDSLVFVTPVFVVTINYFY